MKLYPLRIEQSHQLQLLQNQTYFGNIGKIGISIPMHWAVCNGLFPSVHIISFCKVGYIKGIPLLSVLELELLLGSANLKFKWKTKLQVTPRLLIMR